MRTALNRTRRLVTLLLLALSAWYVFLRRRVPAAGSLAGPGSGPVGAGRSGAELGAPGELPEDVLATDAGLTELPDAVPATDAGLTELPDAAGGSAAVELPDGTIVVDEVRVGELLAEGPDGEPALVEVVEETITIADLSALSATTDTPDPAAAAADPAAADVAVPAGAGPDSVALVTAVVDGETGGDGAVAPVIGTVPGHEEPTEQFAPGLEDGIEDPTNEIPRPVFVETPSPAFSEAPTMEMPVLMDDLRAVRGVGPSMERMLHGLGIVSFRQLARLDGSELERVRDELRDFRGRIDREDWIGQARQLHKTKYGTEPV